jgi:hypothetical protein
MNRSDSASVGVIFNPHARKNRKASRNLSKLKKAVGDRGLVVETNSVEEIAAALEKFAANGIDTVIADGGDGAMHWAINEAIECFGLQRTREEFRFAPSAGGTIDFIANALGVSGKPAEIADRTARAIAQGHGFEEVELKCLRLEVRYASGETEVRYAYGAAIAGYAANFYGPFYRSYRFRGPVRIVGLLGYAFGTAAAGSAFRGPLERLKPKFIEDAEYDFLRPMIGEVELGGEPFAGGGESGREFNLLQCGAVHINLGNVIKVFEAADDMHFHSHVGYLNTVEMLPEVIRAGAGMGIGSDDVHDGAAQTLRVKPDPPSTLIPCLDGELFEDVAELYVERGPAFRFVVA